MTTKLPPGVTPEMWKTEEERKVPAWLKEETTPYFNPEEIWPDHPQYSDWLQDNRDIYGTGMASDPLTIAAGNPYEGYLRFMGENYAGNQSGTDWVDRQFEGFYGNTPDSNDDAVTDPVVDNEDVIRRSTNKPRIKSKTFR